MSEDEQFEEFESFQIDRESLDSLLQNARAFESPDIPQKGDLTSEIENRRPRQLDEKEVKVMGVYEHQEQGMPPSAFVLLRDNQDRQVVIFIGRFEAIAIAAALEGEVYDRPMTHDLLKNTIERMGGRIERIIIDDLWQSTYYAKVSINTGNETMDIDSRPSDGIALALRASAPIYMAEAVLEQSAINQEM